MISLILSGLLSLLNLPLNTGHITLMSTLSCEATPPTINTSMLIENVGNEAAYNIRVMIKLAEYEWYSDIVPILDINNSIVIDNLDKYEPTNEGSYPLIGKIYFQDSAGHIYTSVITTIISYKDATVPDVFAEWNDLELSNKDVLKMKITNMGYDDLDLNINILVPDELSVQPYQGTFALKARSKDEICIDIENFNALVGAVYPAWSIIEYENKGHHFTFVSSGNITIIQEVNIFKKYWWLSLIVVAIIIIIFIWYDVF